MRRFLSVSAFVAALLVLTGAPMLAEATTTSSTSSTSSTIAPLILCSATTTIVPLPGETVPPVAPCALTPGTTTTTTTTTLPSAVTTVPEGCALPPLAQAVFLGTLLEKDLTSGTFQVTQVRAGSLEGYVTADNRVTVRYGNDVKYLDLNTSYIVGVKQDAVSLKLASSVRDSAELFGGAEVAGSNVQCPEFEDPARTLHLDGSAISAGIFTKFFDQPWRLLLVVIVPPVVVLAGLYALVSLKRGARSATPSR